MVTSFIKPNSYSSCWRQSRTKVTFYWCHRYHDPTHVFKITW
uniref:Uncharacterized protein n=1 Tax=Anguilla anguilla TaxID=7936 RepID=A0A0E9WK25_ANGAN